MNNIRRANKGIVWGIGLSDDTMGKTLQEYYPLLNIPLYIIQTLRSYYIHYKRNHGTRKKHAGISVKNFYWIYTNTMSIHNREYMYKSRAFELIY